ncbi:hypothetical protein NMY22_g16798 [Coprinellus aureogranulatus]|nr:hypothetical protein NMY22_g16798 [Coprinellus aureogranulatus]
MALNTPPQSVVYLPIDAFLADDCGIVLPRSNTAQEPSNPSRALERRTHNIARNNPRVVRSFTRLVSAVWRWVLAFLQAWNIALALSDICNLACSTVYGAAPGQLNPSSCRQVLPFRTRTRNVFVSREPQLILHGQQLTDITAIIRRMNDHLGVDTRADRDLTLHGATAHILPELTTPSEWRSPGWFKSAILEFDQASAHNVFQDPPVVGQCWRFSGHQGFAAIQLEEPANITAISLVSPLREHLSTAMTLEAPRSVRVWAVSDAEERTSNTNCLNERRPLSDFAGSGDVPVPHTSKSLAVLLKEFTYSIHLPQVRQLFELAHSSCNIGPFSVVIIEIMDNWGADATCVYHVGVHGVACN